MPSHRGLEQGFPGVALGQRAERARPRPPRGLGLFGAVRSGPKSSRRQAYPRLVRSLTP